MLVTDLIHWKNHQHNEKSRQYNDSVGHHHKITDITLSPTSLSPTIFDPKIEFVGDFGIILNNFQSWFTQQWKFYKNLLKNSRNSIHPWIYINSCSGTSLASIELKIIGFLTRQLPSVLFGPSMYMYREPTLYNRLLHLKTKFMSYFFYYLLMPS